MLVGIDTGIQSGIDAEQGEWLRKISKMPKDKILLTGKPLVVDADRKTCPIAGGGTVNAIVDDPDNRYVAVIGGDIHNFQRYPVRSPGDRVVQHIVTGAAGAYTKATHRIPTASIASCGCAEDDFRCYPRRGDSLAAYSMLLDQRLPLNLAIDPELTPEAMRQLLDNSVVPSRAEDRGKSPSADALAKAKRVVFFSDSKILGPLSKNFSEFLDWNESPPPLFKSFLKIETGRARSRSAASGSRAASSTPTTRRSRTGSRAPAATTAAGTGRYSLTRGHFETKPCLAGPRWPARSGVLSRVRILRIRTLPASLARTRPAHPDEEASFRNEP